MNEKRWAERNQSLKEGESYNTERRGDQSSSWRRAQNNPGLKEDEGDSHSQFRNASQAFLNRNRNQTSSWSSFNQNNSNSNVSRTDSWRSSGQTSSWRKGSLNYSNSNESQTGFWRRGVQNNSNSVSDANSWRRKTQTISLRNVSQTNQSGISNRASPKLSQTNPNRKLSVSTDEVWNATSKDLVVLSVNDVSMSVCLTKTTFFSTGFLDENQIIVLQLLAKKNCLSGQLNHEPCKTCSFFVYQKNRNMTPTMCEYGTIDTAIMNFERKFKQAVSVDWPEQGLKQGWQGFTRANRFYNNSTKFNARYSKYFNYDSLNSHVKELFKLCNGNPPRNFKSAPAEFRRLWCGMPDEQVFEARKTLFDILKCLRDGQTNELSGLSSAFYTLVPCWTTNKNTMTVNNYTKLGGEINRLDFIEGVKNDFPKRLRYVEEESEVFKMIEAAVRTTHGPNHKFELKLDKVFSFDGEDLTIGKKPVEKLAADLKPASIGKPAPQEKKALDLKPASAWKSVPSADQVAATKTLLDDCNLSKNLDKKLSFENQNSAPDTKSSNQDKSASNPKHQDQKSPPKPLLLWHGTNSTCVPGILKSMHTTFC